MSHSSRFVSALAVCLTLASTEFVRAQSISPPSETAEDLFSVLKRTEGAGKFLRAVSLAAFEDELESVRRATLFVPSDDAFEALDPRVMERLFDPAGADRLAALIRHHKAEWNVTAESLNNIDGILNEAGRMLPVVRSAGDVWVGSAQVIRSDIRAENGVIHLVDRVILPEKRNLLGALRLHGDYSRFLELVDIADLKSLLEDDGPMTLFVPTDRAFATLSKYEAQLLFDRDNPALARSFVSAHVIPKMWTARAALVAGAIVTHDGTTLTTRVHQARIKIGRAELVDTDLMTSNGVVHGIERPLVDFEQLESEDRPVGG